MKTEQVAKDFMKEYDLIKKGVNLETITNVAISMGYEVIYFNPNKEKHVELLKKATNGDFDNSKKSFICEIDGKKTIFIVFFSSDTDKVYLLLHELAHLYMDHTYKTGSSETRKEIQANDFAGCVMNYKKKKRTAIISISAIFITTISIISVSAMLLYNITKPDQASSTPPQAIQSISPSPSPSPIDVDVVIPSEEPAVTADGQESVMVSVTKSGDKYHRPDCHYIVGRTVFTLSIEEAKNAGYTACTYCRPDEL